MKLTLQSLDNALDHSGHATVTVRGHKGEVLPPIKLSRRYVGSMGIPYDAPAIRTALVAFADELAAHSMRAHARGHSEVVLR